jgi:protein TonB
MYLKIVPFIFIGLLFSFAAKCQPPTKIKSQPPKQSSPVEDQKLYMNPAKQAEFAGGAEAWNKYVADSLNTGIPVSKKAPPGQYIVIVRFIVSYWGAISDVKAETHHGYGMEEEAIRLIKKSPRWLPAMQGGRPVNAFTKQPVTFNVTAR